MESVYFQKRDLIKECNDGILKADLALEKQKKLRQRIRLTAEGLKQMNEREASILKVRSDFIDLKEKYKKTSKATMKSLEVEVQDLTKHLNKLLRE